MIQIQNYYYYKFKCYYQNIRILVKNSVERGNTKVRHFFRNWTQTRRWSYEATSVVTCELTWKEKKRKEEKKEGRQTEALLPSEVGPFDFIHE